MILVSSLQNVSTEAPYIMKQRQTSFSFILSKFLIHKIISKIKSWPTVLSFGVMHYTTVKCCPYSPKPKSHMKPPPLFSKKNVSSIFPRLTHHIPKSLISFCPCRLSNLSSDIFSSAQKLARVSCLKINFLLPISDLNPYKQQSSLSISLLNFTKESVMLALVCLHLDICMTYHWPQLMGPQGPQPKQFIDSQPSSS